MKEKTAIYKNVCGQILKAWALAVALTAAFHRPLEISQFAEKIDYVTASIYDLLGAYDFHFWMIFILGFIFYKVTEDKVTEMKTQYRVIAALFAVFLMFGKSYYEVGNWSYLFGSITNFVKAFVVILGYGIFIRRGLCLFALYLDRAGAVSKEKHFFSERAFWKAFAILAVWYSVFVIISYPGNLCWDVIGQIEQVLNGSFSEHHPLAHTLIVGGMVKLGMTLFHSYEAGLFLYMFLQVVMLAAAFAATVSVVVKRNLKPWMVWLMMALYMFTPIYTNLVSTAIKDIPYVACTIGYMVCLAVCLEDNTKLKNVKFLCGFLSLQVAVILLRNNGLMMVLLSGMVICLCYLRKDSLKEGARKVLVFFLVSVVIGLLGKSVLASACDAAPGGKGEILSIPFQQTARYLQVYKDEISVSEKQAIEEVLGSVEKIAASYDPDISDPVKALFDKQSEMGEILNYFGAWFQGLIKHPGEYVEAFLAHVYGWFTPAVPNSIRYETNYDLIAQEGIVSGANKILLFAYRFIGCTPVAALENVGLAVWALFFLCAYAMKKKNQAMAVSTMPLWISLLVCMAAPCFFMHPRYALPIMTILPFLYGFLLTGKKEDQ